ncbi:MAG TPA: Fe-S cluster assembly protein SufD [Anaerolineae bacterium]|nr:Fe-S cluster assembly protein SufD [Anaerolineae bacterium]
MSSVTKQNIESVETTAPAEQEALIKETGRTPTPKAPALAHGFSREALDALIAARPFEPDWMRDVRLESWRVLQDTPVPARTDEPWRRTDFSALKFDELASMSESVDPARALKKTPLLVRNVLKDKHAAGALLRADNTPAGHTFDEALAQRGVIFADLDTALQQHGDLLKRTFMTEVIRPTDGYFAALHGAFWRGGTFLYVPAGVDVSLPLRAATWLSEQSTSFTHTLIILEQGARAVLIDEYASRTKEEPVLACSAVEMRVGPGAQLDYVHWQDWGRNVFNFTHERALIDRDATLHWILAGLGGRLTKSFLDSRLVGPGATALMSGVYFVDGAQHMDYDTEQNHVMGHTKSDLLYKGALKDKSRAVWQGNIHVYPKAQRSDAYQANRNLALSHEARTDSIPGLEIEADDVRCTHGSTVSQIDREEVFYLMSRGIPERVAEQLIVNAFFQPVLDRIPHDSVRHRLEASFAAKMGLA